MHGKSRRRLAEKPQGIQWWRPVAAEVPRIVSGCITGVALPVAVLVA